MRGSLVQRYKGSWSVILDLGVELDSATGRTRRKQKWFTVRGTRKDAERKLGDLLHAANHGTIVEPSKITLGRWLLDWIELARPSIRPSSYVRYKGIIDNALLKSPIAGMALQQIRPSHIEGYYTSASVSPATLTLHHAILHRAFRKAVKDGLVGKNSAADLDNRPRRVRVGEDARQHAWTASEARAFLVAAKSAGTRSAAFYTLALDTGARKGELAGLRWTDVDLDAAKVRITQQLLKPGANPTFGPTKTGTARTITIDSVTVELLRVHKKAQAALKMRNRTVYQDHGLVFTKEWEDVREGRATLGEPLQVNNLGQREYAKLIRAAGVRRIKFHGLRHTCATLLLQAGQPAHVVAQRLGHSKVEMTLNIYAHVLPDMQHEAAAKLGRLLHG